MPNRALTVDLMTAGFPCQDVSVAGKRKGLNGERTGLFWEIIRLARRLRPRWLLLENVPGLLSSSTGARGRDFAVVLAALGQLGYGVAWTCLDAQWFGLAQRRKRVFVVGYLGAPCPAEILFEPESVQRRTPPCRETGEGTARETAACLRGSGVGTERVRDTRGQDNVIPDIAWALQERDAKGPDSDTKEGHLLPVSYGVRRLTPLECERLQGFPDGWTAVNGRSDSARYRMLGNAVPVPVVEWILRRIANAGAQTMADLFCGIGGFALAAERAGIGVMWASEVEKQAVAVYQAHFPAVEMLGDIREIK